MGEEISTPMITKEKLFNLKTFHLGNFIVIGQSKNPSNSAHYNNITLDAQKGQTHSLLEASIAVGQRVLGEYRRKTLNI